MTNTDFVGIFFWHIAEFDGQAFEAVFKKVEESTAQSKFTYYKLTMGVISKSIDEIYKMNINGNKENTLNLLKQLYNRFSEGAIHLREFYPNGFK